MGRSESNLLWVVCGLAACGLFAAGLGALCWSHAVHLEGETPVVTCGDCGSSPAPGGLLHTCGDLAPISSADD